MTSEHASKDTGTARGPWQRGHGGRMLRRMKLVVFVVVLAAMMTEAHAERISALGLAPDGKTLVVASGDKRVRVVSLPDGKQLGRFALPEIPIATAVAPDGKRFAVGGFGMLALYELPAAKKVAAVEKPIGSLSLNALAYSPDGKTIAGAGDAGKMKLFDAKTGAPIKDLTGSEKILNDVAFAPDGKTLAAGGVDNAVFVWSTTGGAPLRTLKAGKGWIDGIAIAPDGKTLAAVDNNGVIWFWDPATGRELAKVTADSGWTNVIAGSRDGTRLAWSGTDGAIHVWDTKQRKIATTLPGFKAVITAIVFSRDRTKLIAGDYNGKLRMYDIAAGAATDLSLSE